MDKNMINIDDLLRQRLSGGEEKERPGAWLQMRELLDEKMPVQTPVAFNWRRMFSYLGVMLLVTTATVGSYKVINSIREDNNTGAPIAATTNVTGNTGGTNPGSGNSGAARIGGYTTESNNSDKDAVVNKTHEMDAKTTTKDNKTVGQADKAAQIVDVDNDNKTQQTQFVATNEKNNKTQQNPSQNTVKQGVDQNATSTAKTTKPTAEHTDTRLTKVNKIQDPAQKNATSNSLNNNSKQDNSQTTTSAAGSINRTVSGGAVAGLNNNTKPENPAAGTAKTNGNNTPSAAANKPAASAGSNNSNTSTNLNPASGAAMNQQPSGNKPAEPQLRDKTEMINKIETKETYTRKDGWKKDTIATGQVEWANGDKVMAMNGTAIHDNLTVEKPVPSSSMSLKANAAETNNAEQLVPLANYKVESKKGNYQKEANFFEQMIRNAKYQMGKAKFYPGIVAGVNTSMSKYSMSGFQLGLSGTLSLNEKWAIFTELKYMHRFNSKLYEGETYYNNPEIDTVQGSIQYSYDKVNQSFQYNTVSTIEMPVAVKYAINRMNLLVGMNFNYNFSIDVQDVSKTTHMPPVYVPSALPAMATKAPELGIDDFSSRFGIGYMLGAGYQVTPSIQLDARMTQIFSDNAKTMGAQQVSKDLYMRPTFQFNFNYRFSSNKYRPYRQH